MGLATLAWWLYAGREDTTPRVTATVETQDLNIPRTRDAIDVTVDGQGGSVVVDVIDREGDALTDSREVTADDRRVVSLPLTESGREAFGTCATGREPVLRVVSDESTRQIPLQFSRDEIRCGPLQWAPPTMEDPEEIVVDDDTEALNLESGQDYVLRLPDEKRSSGLQVYGGRNIVLIGGHITVPEDAETDPERKALSFAEQTGTIHVEGVRIDASGGGEGDGVSIRAPEAVLQLQNMRIDGLMGTEAGTHADVVQPWGGIRELRIDRLTGSSHFQGLQIPEDRGNIGRADLRSVDLRALPGTDGGGHMLWLTHDDCSAYPVHLQRVYVEPRPDRELATTVWPESREEVPCGAKAAEGEVGWPGLPVDGTVQEGTPPGGPFVPLRVPGVDYRSPGYD